MTSIEAQSIAPTEVTPPDELTVLANQAAQCVRENYEAQQNGWEDPELEAKANITFASLVERTEGLVRSSIRHRLNHISRADLDDLAQEVFAGTHRFFCTMKTPIQSFRGWIWTTSGRRAIGFCKEFDIVPVPFDPSSIEFILSGSDQNNDPYEDPESYLDFRNAQADLGEAEARLSPEHLEVINLTMDGMSPRGVREELELPTDNAASALLMRARNKIRQEIEIASLVRERYMPETDRELKGKKLQAAIQAARQRKELELNP